MHELNNCLTAKSLAEFTVEQYRPRPIQCGWFARLLRGLTMLMDRDSGFYCTR